MEWKSVSCLPSCSHKHHRWGHLLPTVMLGPSVPVFPKYRKRSSEIILIILLIFSSYSVYKRV